MSLEKFSIVSSEDYTQLRDEMGLEAAYLRREYELALLPSTSQERREAFFERHRKFLERNAALIEYVTARIESDIHQIKGTIQ